MFLSSSPCFNLFIGGSVKNFSPSSKGIDGTMMYQKSGENQRCEGKAVIAIGINEHLIPDEVDLTAQGHCQHDAYNGGKIQKSHYNEDRHEADSNVLEVHSQESSRKVIARIRAEGIENHNSHTYQCQGDGTISSVPMDHDTLSV
jgi:hypothetical protein